jgi:hypothetical protein
MVVRKTKKATTRPAATAPAPAPAAVSPPVETQPATDSTPLATPIQSTATEISHMSQEEAVKVEPKPAKAKAEAKGSIVKQTPSLSIWERPVMASEVEVIGTLQMAGERPVAASPMGIFGTYLNGRPIQSSDLKIYDGLPGGSAIFLSDFHAVEGLDLPGGRPVMASPSGLLGSDRHFGDRPIFANEADDAAELMGFID